MSIWTLDRERADLEQINIMAAICYLHSFKPEYGSVDVNCHLSGVYVLLLPVFAITRTSQHRFVLAPQFNSSSSGAAAQPATELHPSCI